MNNPIFRSELGADRPLREGDKNDSIKDVRSFLGELGYLRTSEEIGLDSFAMFDSSLSEAVKKYQRFHGLEETGIIDEATRKDMEMPRCGVADLEDGTEHHDPGVSSFVASQGKWNSNHLTFKFINGTNDLAGTSERNIVRQAFEVWAQVTPLSFSEVTGSADATFLISWVTGDHGDNSPFDGPGHILAHAFYPPPINPQPGLAGDIHFDEAEHWSTTHNGNTGEIDLLTVAIHELGHALGLKHSNVGNAIMYPKYSGINRTLASDDIDGIQSIYGTTTLKKHWLVRLLEWILRRFFNWSP